VEPKRSVRTKIPFIPEIGEQANRSIAQAMDAKHKRWMWDRKRDKPIDLSLRLHHRDVLVWAQRQAWWAGPAPPKWVRGGRLNVVEVYAHMCADVAAGDINEDQLAFHFRNLVADCIAHAAKEKGHVTDRAANAQ
jgi:hypothetical protein